jgi:hypothetical protein
MNIRTDENKSYAAVERGAISVVSSKPFLCSILTGGLLRIFAVSFPTNESFVRPRIWVVGIRATLQIRVPEVLCSNLCRDTDYPDRGVPSFPSANPIKRQDSTSNS